MGVDILGGHPSLGLNDGQMERATAAARDDVTLTFAAKYLARREPEDREEADLLLKSVLAGVSSVLGIAGVNGVPSADELGTIVDEFSDAEHEECEGIVIRALKNNVWTELMEHPILRPTQDSVHHKVAFAKGLAEAYRSPFVGNAPCNFIEHLEQIDKEAEDHLTVTPLYAKVISVVQSSGTRKSRMLTEVGAHISPSPFVFVAQIVRVVGCVRV